MTEAPDNNAPLGVERDRVVLFHYDLADAQGQPLESSRGGSPVAIVHGHGNVIVGVERALEGHRAGERLSVTVPPEDGYGPRREDAVQRISKKHIQGPRKLRPGMRVGVQTEHGVRPVTVVKVGSSVVDVDLNHPMAGMTLRFEIEVLEVRAAEPEEIAHGHVHGPGGHAH